MESTATLFYAVSERLQLHWIRSAISKTIVRNHWNNLAIVNMRNELHVNQHNLTEMILQSVTQSVTNKRHITQALEQWEERHAEALERYDHMVNELSAMINLDFPATSVAVSEVRRLASITLQAQQG
jgi:glutamate dehydrogenase